jgi:hypothetical protein
MKTRMFRTLLKGQALSYFEHQLRKRVDPEDSELPDNDLIELVVRDVDLEYIPKLIMHAQKYYTFKATRDLYMGVNTSVQNFAERLNTLNLNLAEENPKQLYQDEIIEILDQAKAKDPEWHEVMVNTNIDIFEKK